MSIIVHIGHGSCVLSCNEFSGSPSRRCRVGIPSLDDEFGVQCFTHKDIPVVLRLGVDGWCPCAGVDSYGLVGAEPVSEEVSELYLVFEVREEGPHVHSGSLPSSMARRFVIFDWATFAAAIVFVMLS